MPAGSCHGWRLRPETQASTSEQSGRVRLSQAGGVHILAIAYEGHRAVRFDSLEVGSRTWLVKLPSTREQFEMRSRLTSDAAKQWAKYIISRGDKGVYYENIYARNILKTKPIACDEEGPFEVHALTCEKDLVSTLWSLKTFYQFSETKPRLVIYEDGSLSEDSISILSGHFLNSQLVRRHQFHHDMNGFLKAHSLSLEFSKLERFYCALKLFGPMCYGRSERLLYFDSDVLFFNKPFELLEHIENGIPFFMSDFQDAYFRSVDVLTELLGVKIEHKVNAGLFHVAKRDLVDNIDLVESYFEKFSGLKKRSRKVNRHEQTLIAILLTKARALRLSSSYQISKQPIAEKTISHHFVNDGSRPYFYTAGLSFLKSIGFIKDFARRA